MGLLGVPTLACSAAYVLNAAVGWPVGMGESLRKAKASYAIIGLSMLIGTGLDFTRISPPKPLFGAAVLNSLLAPPLLAIVLLVSNNRKIMQRYTNGWLLNALGIMAMLIMAGTALWPAVGWVLSIL
jgi:Mn2+/Fe2+ NRAMP family transporter